MVQSKIVWDSSEAGFGSSGGQSSSFTAWPGVVLLRYFQNSCSDNFARSGTPKEADRETDSNKTGNKELQERRAELQELIERAYSEMARRSNR